MRAHQIEQHIPALRRYALSLLRDGNRADDLVQETLLRALSRWQWFRPGDLRAWLFTILHNQFVSEARRETQAPSPLLEEDADRAGRTGAFASAEVAEVLDALALLPFDQRQVLLLVAVEQFTYQEAARMLGIPLGTVMSRLSRGRERLRLLLADDPATRIRRVI